MTWSWLWSDVPFPPAEALRGMPEDYVTLLARKFKTCPPSLPPNKKLAAVRIAGDRSVRKRLAPMIADITTRALCVLEPELLHELLQLEAIDRNGPRPPAPSSAHRASKRPSTPASEHDRWRGLADSLRDLASELHVPGVSCEGPQPAPGEPLPFTFSFPHGGDRAIVHACHLLEQWAADAEQRAAAAAASPAQSAREASNLVRARVEILAEVLRASGDTWDDGDLADLVVASARDWTHPPSPLARTYTFDVRSPARYEDPNRLALAAWIGKQLAARR